MYAQRASLAQCQRLAVACPGICSYTCDSDNMTSIPGACAWSRRSIEIESCLQLGTTRTAAPDLVTVSDMLITYGLLWSSVRNESRCRVPRKNVAGFRGKARKNTRGRQGTRRVMLTVQETGVYTEKEASFLRVEWQAGGDKV